MQTETEAETATEGGEESVQDGHVNSDEETSGAQPETTTTPTAASGENLRQVTREEAEAYAKEAGGLLFFEASAKTGKGVQELFTEIGKSSCHLGAYTSLT